MAGRLLGRDAQDLGPDLPISGRLVEEKLSVRLVAEQDRGLQGELRIGLLAHLEPWETGLHPLTS